jgi:hypothetical protein
LGQEREAMAVPTLTPEQRARALEKAGEARRERASLKHALADGRMDLRELLNRAATDDMAGGLKVEAALVSLPGVGKVKAARIMEKLGIADNRRLRGLGARQREGLLDALS